MNVSILEAARTKFWDLGAEDLHALRHTCIEKVMNLNGSITLDDAVKWQE